MSVIAGYVDFRIQDRRFWASLGADASGADSMGEIGVFHHALFVSVIMLFCCMAVFVWLSISSRREH